MSTTAALQTHRSKWPRFAPSATRAPKSVRPTQPEQILMAGLLGAKSCFQLVDIARVILHRQSPLDQTYYILGLPASSKYPINRYLNVFTKSCAELNYLEPVHPRSNFPCGDGLL